MTHYSPMLAALGDESALDLKGYIFEPKLDGFRALLYKEGGKISLISRNGNSLTSMFPELAGIGKSIQSKRCVLDGEIVIYSEGVPNFNLLQRRARENVISQSLENPATFIAFDIIENNGTDLRSIPLMERKKILSTLVTENERIQQSIYTKQGKRLLAQMRKLRMEGVIAKKETGTYQEKRTRDWIKIKLLNTADCVIIGYSSNKRQIASLALACYDGHELIYVGNVGTGFNESMLAHLLKLLQERTAEKVPMLRMEKGMPRLTFARPELVCEVKYLEFTRTRRMRAPVFLRLRDDKKPKECQLSQFHVAEP